MVKLSTDNVEKIIVGVIILILSVTFFMSDDGDVKPKVIIDELTFDEFPLVAWKDTHEKWNGELGDIVKIKYRVFNKNTKVWIYDELGTLVHKQPFERNPNKNGTPRDFTYSWKLYKSEHSQEIEVGEYQIVLGGLFQGGFGQMKTTIKI
jgi:hypothetical protein